MCSVIQNGQPLIGERSTCCCEHLRIFTSEIILIIFQQLTNNFFLHFLKFCMAERLRFSMFLMKIYLIVLLNRIKMLANQTRFKILRLFSCSCPPCLIDWKGQNNENLLYLFDVFMHLSNHISLKDPV